MQRLRNGEAMKSQMNFLERRKRPRVGVMAQLEDITYSILRKHSTPRQGSRCRGISKSAQPLALDEKGAILPGLFERDSAQTFSASSIYDCHHITCMTVIRVD